MAAHDLVPPAAATLEGRDTELEAIGLRDSGRATVLLGEPGAGKTALLAAASERARSAGVLVVRANGVEFEADIPYAGLGQVALLLVEVLDGLAAGHRQVLRTALGIGEGPFPTMAAVANVA